MKYLKLFENYYSLFNFCEDHLIELIDNGFHIIIDESEQTKYLYYLNIRRAGAETLWDNIKDVIIPFTQILNNKYDIIQITLKGYSTYRFSIKDILEDNIPTYIRFNNIEIRFAMKGIIRKTFERYQKDDDLNELCQLQLVELSDIGCQFRVTDYQTVGDQPAHKIFSLLSSKYVKWSLIKDIILTFIDSILIDYDIDNFTIRYKLYNSSHSVIPKRSLSKFSIDDLDTIDDNFEISNLSFDFF